MFSAASTSAVVELAIVRFMCALRELHVIVVTTLLALPGFAAIQAPDHPKSAWGIGNERHWTSDLPDAANYARRRYPCEDIDTAVQEAAAEFATYEASGKIVSRSLVFMRVMSRCLDQCRMRRSLPIENLNIAMLRHEPSDVLADLDQARELANRIETRAHGTLYSAGVSVPHRVIHGVLQGLEAHIGTETIAVNSDMTNDQIRTIVDHLRAAAVIEQDLLNRDGSVTLYAGSLCKACGREALQKSEVRDSVRRLSEWTADQCLLLANASTIEPAEADVLARAVQASASTLYLWISVADAADRIRLTTELVHIRRELEALVAIDPDASIAARHYVRSLAEDGRYPLGREFERQLTTTSSFGDLVGDAIRKSSGFRLFELKSNRRHLLSRSSTNPSLYPELRALRELLEQLERTAPMAFSSAPYFTPVVRGREWVQPRLRLGR
jgi:hypothetical protein